MTSSAAPVIHINGWPGTGKLTIARALACRIRAQVLHNHLMLDAAGAVFHRGTSEHARLRSQVTSLLLDAARTLPGDVAVIATNALADTPEDQMLFAPFQQLAHDRGAPLHLVTLSITLSENQRRLANPARAEGSKLNDPEYLKTLRHRYRLLSPPDACDIDVTDLTAQEASAEIQTRLGLAHG